MELLSACGTLMAAMSIEPVKPFVGRGVARDWSGLVLFSGVWQRYQGVIGMKLEIARGLFLVGALSVTALAAAAWQEPAMQVVNAQACAEQPCPVVSARHDANPVAKADSDNLLLLIFGLSHAMKGEQ
jgi:hypothetical protein